MARVYRMAAIDVGTNSIHMIVVEAHRHGYRVIDKEKQMAQLGRGSLEGRPLTEEAIERGVATLRTMAEIARRWKVNEIVAVATSAVREAPNRRRFISAVEKASKIKLRVISGEEEADYIYRAVRSAVDFHGGTALMIDIGGGSIELIVGTGEEVFFTHSEPAGAMRMSQRFGFDGPADAKTVAQCRSYVRKALKKPLAQISTLGFDFTIGTSGTAATLAELAAKMSTNGESISSGLTWLSRRRLEELIDVLAPLDVDTRVRRLGLDPKRAATIVGGAITLDEIMKELEVEQLRVCDAALREGIVEAAMAKRNARKEGAVPAGSVRRAGVIALAEKTHIDMTHARHVASLALRIFDQTQEHHLLRTGERELLEYAALLHEAGMHVSYQGHHKHSYYLISHAGLRGLTADQVAMIANVVRYHRKALPDDTDANLAQLSRPQRDVVKKLVAILRLADALDRGRRGAVRDVAVDAGKKRFHFHLRLRDRAELEREAVERKTKFFARVFDRPVDFDIAAR